MPNNESDTSTNPTTPQLNPDTQHDQTLSHNYPDPELAPPPQAPNSTPPSVFIKEPTIITPQPNTPESTRPLSSSADISDLKPDIPPTTSKFSSTEQEPLIEFEDTPKPQKKFRFPAGTGPFLIITALALLASALLYYWYYILQPSLILRRSLNNLTELSSGKMIATFNPKNDILSASLETQFHKDTSLLSYYTLKSSYKAESGLVKDFSISTYINNETIFVKASHSDIRELDKLLSSQPLSGESGEGLTLGDLSTYKILKQILLGDSWLRFPYPDPDTDNSHYGETSQEIYANNKDTINMSLFKSLKINTVDRSHEVGGTSYLYIAFGFKREELTAAINDWATLDPTLSRAKNDIESLIANITNLDSDLIEVLINQETSQIIQIKLNTPKLEDEYYQSKLTDLESSSPGLGTLAPPGVLDTLKDSLTTRYERPELLLTLDFANHNTLGRLNPPELTIDYSELSYTFILEQSLIYESTSTILPAISSIYPESTGIRIPE